LYGTENKVGVQDFDHLSVLISLDNPCAAAITNLESVVKDLAGEVKKSEKIALTKKDQKSGGHYVLTLEKR